SDRAVPRMSMSYDHCRLDKSIMDRFDPEMAMFLRTDSRAGRFTLFGPEIVMPPPVATSPYVPSGGVFAFLFTVTSKGMLSSGSEDALIDRFPATIRSDASSTEVRRFPESSNPPLAAVPSIMVSEGR